MVITIHDSTGRLIRSLNMGYKPAGYYLDRDKAAYWDGKNSWGENVANGVYLCKIGSGASVAVRKMVVIE